MYILKDQQLGVLRVWNNDQRMKWFKRSAKISIHWSSSPLCFGKTQGLKDA